MKDGPNIALVAALIGDSARADMLSGLMDGRALTVGELARSAGIGLPTASAHVAKLEEAGLIETRKSFIHRRANTRLFITDAGRDAISGYVEGLRSLMERVQNWQPAVDDYRGFYET